MNESTSKKRNFGTSMGVSSIIAILVILVLIVFSALSVTTSKADLVLSQKTADSIAAFYKADSLAEEQLAFIAKAVAGGGDIESSLRMIDLASNDVSGDTIKYSIAIDKKRLLNVQLKIEPDGKITKEIWQIVPSGESVPDETLDLYEP